MTERDRIRAEYQAALDAGQGVVDLGDTVLCDGCDTDLTADPRSGGILFGSYAYGPCCAARMLDSIRGYDEEWNIRARCPDGMSFADWCRQLRGGSNAIVVRPM